MNPGIEIRNTQLELHQFRLRLAILAGFVLVMFALLFTRFFYLQVVMHAHYQTLAEANRISIVPIAPNRGVIVDRNGVVLAHNYSAYTLEIMPGKVADLDSLIDALGEIVAITPRDRWRKASASRACPYAHAFPTRKSRGSPSTAIASRAWT